MPPNTSTIVVFTLGENTYEVEKLKSTICLDLPVQIGCFVCGYAKLHMLGSLRGSLGFGTCANGHGFIVHGLVERLARGRRQSRKTRSGEIEVVPAESGARRRHSHRSQSAWHRTSGFRQAEAGLLKIEWTGDAMVALCSKT